MAFLPEGTEAIASSTTDEFGNFMIQGLADVVGGYILKITTEGFNPYESAAVNVTVGAVTTVGTIELEAEI